MWAVNALFEDEKRKIYCLIVYGPVLLLWCGNFNFFRELPKIFRFNDSTNFNFYPTKKLLPIYWKISNSLVWRSILGAGSSLMKHFQLELWITWIIRNFNWLWNVERCCAQIFPLLTHQNTIYTYRIMGKSVEVIWRTKWKKGGWQIRDKVKVSSLRNKSENFSETKFISPPIYMSN